MEIFRVLAADSVIIPVFSRHSRSSVEKDSRAFKKILARLAKRYARKFWYRNRFAQLSRIILFEAVSLRLAIMKKEAWQPYSYRWGHRHRC